MLLTKRRGLVDANLLQGFYLDELFIEPLKGHVSGKDVSRHLTPKAGEVLLHLAQRPGELVARETLLEEAWGPGQGSTEALSHAISELRHALGDDPDAPRFVQTVPRRGYRLVVTPVPTTRHTDSIVIGANQGPDDLGLLENLKRRGVLETALAYLILGWLIIQVADIVFDQLHLPSWAGTVVTVFVIAGFPIALVLSWYLEFRDGRAVLQDASPQDVRRRRFSRTYISIVGALALASVFVFLYDRQFGLPTQAEPDAVPVAAKAAAMPIVENSIAVLPFMNIDGSNETQVFANGLVDDVINRLARVPGLRVSSRGDSFSLDPNSASADVRKRLRVAMYIEGSVEIATDTIRVIVQIIDSATGYHIQSRTFDHPRQDYFHVRDEVTALTVSSLRVTLPEDIQDLSQATSHTPVFDAYVLYRRGVDELDKPGNITTLGTALGWMDAALEVDPEYAAAYAGKCRAYVVLFRETNDPENIDKAEVACANALNRNPGLYVVHAALGDLYLRKGMYNESEAAYIEALRINPQSVDAMIFLADVYRLQKRADQAEGLLRNALGLQPGNWRAYAALGHFYYRRGAYLDAAEQYETILSLDDQNERGLLGLAASLMLAGDFEGATPVIARAIDVRPDATNYSNLALMHYYLGRYEEAVEAIRSGLDLAPTDHLMWANLGDIFTAADKPEDAHASYVRAKELVVIELDVNPNDPVLLMDSAWIRAMLGDEQAARETIAKTFEITPDDPYASYIEALIFLRYDDPENALSSLEQAVADGYSTTILRAEPLLATLRGHTRFEALTNAN